MTPPFGCSSCAPVPADRRRTPRQPPGGTRRSNHPTRSPNWRHLRRSGTDHHRPSLLCRSMLPLTPPRTAAPRQTNTPRASPRALRDRTTLARLPPNGLSPCAAPPLVYDAAGHVSAVSPRKTGRAPRALGRTRRAALVLFGLLAGWSAQASGAERSLRVLGSTTLEGRVTRTSEGRLRVEGGLIDDAGRPVSGASVRLRVEQAHRGVEPCDAEAPLRRSGRELLLTTSAGGVYCFELAAELEGSPIHLRYEDPNGFLSAAELELRAAPAPRALDLVLTTPPDLPLDTPVHVFEIDALPRPTRDDGAARLAAPWSAVSIELTLESPHGQRRRLGVAQLVAESSALPDRRRSPHGSRATPHGPPRRSCAGSRRRREFTSTLLARSSSTSRRSPPSSLWPYVGPEAPSPPAASRRSGTIGGSEPAP